MRSFSPIFLCFAFHRWCLRIFDLEPMRRTPGFVKRAEPFRYDTLAAELAGVLEENVAVAFEKLV
jgi:hypothetical protein